MSHSVEQHFSELHLSQEDHDQIYEQDDHQDQRLVKNIFSISFRIELVSV